MSVARAHAPRPEARPVPAAPRRWREVLGVSLAFGLLSAFVAFAAGLPRPAMTPDSTAYLNAAANLLQGKGLVLTLTPLDVPERSLPFAAWPPLYPILIALLGTGTRDLIAAAGALQGVILGLTALPAGLLAYRLVGRRSVLPVLAFLVVLRSQLVTASFIWSEPLFLLLTLASLSLLLEALREERYASAIRTPLLFAAGVLAGAAMLTRYLGIVVIATGVVALVLHAREEASARKTASQMAVFAVPALLPNLAWIARNRFETGFLFGERRGASFLDPEGIVLATLRTLWTDTFLPPVREGGWGLLLLGLGLLSISAVFWAALHRFGPEAFTGRPDRKRIANTLVVFLCLYLMTVVALSLLVSFDGINTRMLAPVYPVLVLLGAFLLRPVFLANDSRPVWTRRSFQAGIVVCLAILWGLQAASAARYVRAPREERTLSEPYWRSIAFGEPRWASDPTVVGLPRFAASTDLIVTNIPEVVSLWTGRDVKSLPLRSQPVSGSILARHEGAIVLVHPGYRRLLWGVEEMDELVARGVCEKLGRSGEGVFYRVLG